MVERVAKAMNDAYDGDYGKVGFADLARVAIQAMREPTTHMGAIAAQVMLTAELLGNGNDPRILQEDDRRAISFSDHLSGNPTRWYMLVWRAMIDEALRDE